MLGSSRNIIIKLRSRGFNSPPNFVSPKSWKHFGLTKSCPDCTAPTCITVPSLLDFLFIWDCYASGGSVVEKQNVRNARSSILYNFPSPHIHKPSRRWESVGKLTTKRIQQRALLETRWENLGKFSPPHMPTIMRALTLGELSSRTARTHGRWVTRERQRARENVPPPSSSRVVGEHRFPSDRTFQSVSGFSDV